MLASIQKVIKVDPIEGADKIERIQILGWELVAGKGEFKKGDYCVYIEIDTIVPPKPEFEFLRKHNFRIKTIKLRGQISQGIALPMKVLPDGYYPIGLDVSALLQVEKYEKPIPFGMGGVIRRAGLPFNIPITDEARIQSIPEILNEVRGHSVYITTKCDGSSGTYAIKDSDYHVCSRNNSWFRDEKNIFWKISDKYDIRRKLASIERNLAIQGEVCGPGIQKNRLGLKEFDLFVFNIFDIDKYKYLNYSEMLYLTTDMELKMVPLEKVVNFTYSIDELLIMAQGNYKGTNNRKEGIVVRTTDEVNGKIISFKVLNNDYLLKDEE